MKTCGAITQNTRFMAMADGIQIQDSGLWLSTGLGCGRIHYLTKFSKFRCGYCIDSSNNCFAATNVLIGNGVEIGEDCLIFNDVTLGTTGQEFPKIGNNVTIYPGARILGKVVIGDNSVIGANCVVMKDTPSDTVLLPVPSRMIPRSLSPVARKADQRSTKKGQILG